MFILTFNNSLVPSAPQYSWRHCRLDFPPQESAAWIEFVMSTLLLTFFYEGNRQTETYLKRVKKRMGIGEEGWCPFKDISIFHIQFPCLKIDKMDWIIGKLRAFIFHERKWFKKRRRYWCKISNRRIKTFKKLIVYFETNHHWSSTDVSWEFHRQGTN